jgi:radical SAM superfamily enzyme YgiQ (UPF0313 family)
MAAHPGCTEEHMRRLRRFLGETLRHIPEQVQIFTPTPSTLSTAMYHAGTDLEGRPLFVEKDRNRKQRQKDVVRPEGPTGPTPRPARHVPRRPRRPGR